jgi:hypothetical protein
MSRRAKSPVPAAGASEKFALDPAKSDAKGTNNLYVTMLSMSVIPNLLIAGITAAGLFYGGSVSSFSRKRVKTLSDRSAGPLLLGLWMLNLTHAMLVAQVLEGRRATGCNAPDQHIYKVMGTGELVLMDDDGANGKFNRAQRGLASMAETAFIFVVGLLPICYVFPWTAALLVFMFAYSRWSYAAGYASKRTGRMGGFMFMHVLKEAGFGIILCLGVYATYLEVKVYYPTLDLSLPPLPEPILDLYSQLKSKFL